MKKFLLVTTAVIEVGAGLTFLIWPSAAVALLFGTSLDMTAGLTLGRVAGVALLALGLACWLSRHDVESHTAKALFAAMLLYNCGVVLIFAFAGIASGLVGVALWPAIALHIAMTVWCIVQFRPT